jgi:hypothetical protein
MCIGAAGTSIQTYGEATGHTLMRYFPGSTVTLQAQQEARANQTP